MGEQDDGGPAFPAEDDDDYFYGMSLRDYFAGQALVGQYPPGWTYPKPEQVAKWAYEIADAMLAARKR